MIRHTKNPFGIYSGEVPGKPVKPDPTLALELAAKMKVKPTQIALIGDSAVDVQTAKNAGMISIGAAWGYQGKKALQEAGADLVFDTATELSIYLDAKPLCP